MWPDYSKPKRRLGRASTSGLTETPRGLHGLERIADGLGYTNGYTANLFFNQAQLKPSAVDKLKARAFEGL